MSLFRTILHATDFSACSAAACRLACALARHHHSRLVIAHVLAAPVAAYVGGSLVPDPASHLKEMQHKLERVGPADAGFEVERLLVGGEPAAEILRFAREQSCDLIVLGTHGRTGLPRLVLGSVAEQVVRKAPCPVLTVKS
jgi:nucleotide-binding universal stress UspA family protein